MIRKPTRQKPKKYPRIPGAPIRSTKGPSAEDIELVLSFINAMPPHPENKDGKNTLYQWLTMHGDRFQAGEPTADDYDRARTVRAGFHALIASRTGAFDEQAVQDLKRLAGTMAIRTYFDADDTTVPRAAGTTVVTPASDGFDGVLERLLAIVMRARLEHHWPRFKLCADEACGRAFFETSRNLSARWCSPTCRKRHAARTHRRRRRKAKLSW